MADAKTLERVAKLNPIDDIMFRKLAEDDAFLQEILRVILMDDELVVEGRVQMPITNLQGRSVTTDAICRFGDGTRGIVEVQKRNYGIDYDQKRVRYEGALLTANVTETGESFENVPNVVVVYIADYDIFGGKHPLYHVERVVRETGEKVDNGFAEIYVNAKAKELKADDDEMGDKELNRKAGENGANDKATGKKLGRQADKEEANGDTTGKKLERQRLQAVIDLMRVFTENDYYDEKFPVTSSGKKRLKGTEEGRNFMGNISDIIREEGRNEGRGEGKEEVARAMLSDGVDEAMVMKYSGLSAKRIEALKEGLALAGQTA